MTEKFLKRNINYSFIYECAAHIVYKQTNKKKKWRKKHAERSCFVVRPLQLLQ